MHSSDPARRLYYAARDDLFFADENNWLVRVLCVRNSAGELRDMYRASLVCSVYHICDSDTLLVCSREKGPDQKLNNWLVALGRNRSDVARDAAPSACRPGAYCA